MSSRPVLEVRSDLGRWRTAWDELVAAQALPSPFQRSWWLESVAPDTATYVLVRQGDVLVGGVALGVARRLGSRRYVAPGPAVLCPDHLDALSAPGTETAVVDALADWFRSSGPRLADVRGLVPDSLLARAVGGRTVADDVAPYQPLDGADYLSTRSSSFRRSVRRGSRKLAEHGLVHRRVEGPSIPAALDAFATLHGTRDGREPLVAEMPTLRRAVIRGAELGEARVDVLGSDTEVVAVSLALVLAGRTSLYQVARSTAPEHGSAGTALLAAVVEDAAAQGGVEVDLLRGDEDYKSSFADARRPLERLRAAHGPRATAVLAAEDAVRRIRARRVSARRRPPDPGPAA